VDEARAELTGVRRPPRRAQIVPVLVPTPGRFGLDGAPEKRRAPEQIAVCLRRPSARWI
jgi:hypothetical protein